MSRRLSRRFFFPLVILGLLSCGLSAPAAERSYSVSIAAGDRAHGSTPLLLELPANAPKGYWQLQTSLGILPAHSIDERHVLIILPPLEQGKTLDGTLKFTDSPTRSAPLLAMASRNDVVSFSTNGRSILTYQGAPSPLPEGFEQAYQRGGYIHPVYTPAGKIVTDDYPKNHKHHHGIWAPWTKTSFEGRAPDFWNMGDKKGRVEFVKLESTFADAVCAGLRTQHRFVDLLAKPEPKTALNETWEVVVYPPMTVENHPLYLFDLTIHQTCATDSPLLLPKYYYGGLGFRGNFAWNGAGAACTFLSSEGKTRANGNETRASWAYIGGKIEGEQAGIAIFSHPSNFRHPQPVRMHPSEPFFCFAPSQLGDWAITPDKPYTAKYRFVTMDGAPDVNVINRLYDDYANPPEVSIR